MKIIADSFFSIGRSHQICEDYCIHGELPNPYVILADGCSSSENTDVGARLLVHSLQEKLQYCNPDWETDKPERFVGRQAMEIGQSIGLGTEAMDATLGCIYELNGFIYSKIFGDGISVLGIRDNEEKGILLSYDHITYEHEMPYYLSYLFDEKRDNEYKKIAPKKYIQYGAYFTSEEVVEELKTVVSFSDLYSSRSLANRIKFVMISSDGLDSFKNIKTGEDIPLHDIVKRFTNFKVPNGEFVKRTARRTLKDLAKEDIYPMDDISLGCLLVKMEENDQER